MELQTLPQYLPLQDYPEALMNAALVVQDAKKKRDAIGLQLRNGNLLNAEGFRLLDEAGEAIAQAEINLQFLRDQFEALKVEPQAFLGEYRRGRNDKAIA